VCMCVIVCVIKSIFKTLEPHDVLLPLVICQKLAFTFDYHGYLSLFACRPCFFFYNIISKGLLESLVSEK